MGGPISSTNVQGVIDLIHQRQAAQQQIKEAFKEGAWADKVLCWQALVGEKFPSGGVVYLKLKPYKQTTLHTFKVWKLSPRYAGPFQVQIRVGAAAYRLVLPPHTKIHLVFHFFYWRRRWVQCQPSLPLCQILIMMARSFFSLSRFWLDGLSRRGMHPLPNFLSSELIFPNKKLLRNFCRTFRRTILIYWLEDKSV